MSTIHGEQLRVGTIPNSALTTNPLDRANHTGTQAASTISDFNATTRAQVVLQLVEGSTNVHLTQVGSGATQTLEISVDIPASGLTYKGAWDASTNTPALTSSVGVTGDYYIVNVAGSTNLDGISDWGLGDWVMFSGTVWQKIDNSDAVSSVFGRLGNITAQIGDYTASQVTFVPASGILATDVQSAIEEVKNDSIQLTNIDTFEQPAGLINGANTIYTSAYTLTAGRYLVMRNGVIQDTDDYSFSSPSTITFTVAPKVNDKIRVFHIG